MEPRTGQEMRHNGTECVMDCWLSPSVVCDATLQHLSRCHCVVFLCHSRWQRNSWKRRLSHVSLAAVKPSLERGICSFTVCLAEGISGPRRGGSEVTSAPLAEEKRHEGLEC